MSTTTSSAPAAVPATTAAARRLVMDAVPVGGLAGSAAAGIFAPPSAEHHAPGAGHEHAAPASAGALQPLGSDQTRRVLGVGRVRLSVDALAPAGPARRVAPGRYEAELRLAEPGTYRVSLESERANLRTRSGHPVTLQVTA